MTESVRGKRESQSPSTSASLRRPSRRQRVQETGPTTRQPSTNLTQSNNSPDRSVDRRPPSYQIDTTFAMQAMNLEVVPRNFTGLSVNAQQISTPMKATSSRVNSTHEPEDHDVHPAKEPRLPVDGSNSRDIPSTRTYEWPSREKANFSRGYEGMDHLRSSFQSPPCTNARQHPAITPKCLTKGPEPVRYECCLELIFMIGVKNEAVVTDIQGLMRGMAHDYNQRLGSYYPKMLLGKVPEPDGQWHLLEPEGSFATPPSKIVKLKLISPRFDPSFSAGKMQKHPITAAMSFLTKNYLVTGKAEERIGVEHCGSAIRVFKANGWEEVERKRLAQALVKFEQLLTTNIVPSQGKKKNWRDNPHLGGAEQMSTDAAIHQIDLIAESEGLMGSVMSTSLMAVYMSPNRNHRWGQYTWDLAPKKDHSLAYRGLPKFGRGPHDSDPRSFKGDHTHLDDQIDASTVDLLWWSGFLVRFTETALACSDSRHLIKLPSTFEGLRRFMCPGQSQIPFSHHGLGAA